MLELIQNVLNKVLLDNVDMSTAQPSEQQSIEGITCYAVQFNWTGFTGDGTETISTSASNDGITWTAVDTFIPTGTTGSRMLNVEKAGYRFVRIFYVPGTTVGNLTAHISGKVI